MASTSADGMVAAVNARNMAKPVLPTIDTSRIGSSSSRQSEEPESSNTPLQSSSKTAAFFGSSINMVRPASLSVSSGSSSLASPMREFRELSKDEEEADEVGNSSTLSRFGSWRGSQKGNRQWDNFEGKPVTPLPSPGVIGNESYSRIDSRNVFESEYERKNRSRRSDSSSRRSSHDRQDQSHVGAFDISISDSFSSLPSLASMGSMATPTSSADANQQSTMTTSSSKTKNFFGNSRPVLPTSKSSYSGQSSSESSTSSPPLAVPRRLPSHASLFYEPSRLPSAPFETGGSIVGLTAGSPTSTTPTTRTPTLQSDLSSGLPPSDDRGITDADVLPPNATISPPSPQPQTHSSDYQPDSAPSSGFLSSFPSSPPIQRNQSRHAYGPSENATGSSLLPTRNGAIQGKHAQTGRDETRGREEQYVEESEDESTGRIGRYQIEKTLGVGAFSRVALASEIRSSGGSQDQSQKTGRLVALKMLEREPCKQNGRMRVSWVREVEVLKHIVHPNIVRFLSAFSTPRHHNLILERVAGGELFDLVSNRHDSLAEREWLVRILFGEMANAVGWMHSINLVHRDIKLENIILTHQLFSGDALRPSLLPRSPLLKISDFGLSRFVDAASPLLDTRCGSEEYAAPELIIGKRYDGRKTDVWALGVVLYSLLSGSLPFLSIHEDHQTIAKGYSRERGAAEQGSLARKAHLLRIAKGDLRWPMHINEDSLDKVQLPCPPNHRLITPLARRLVARLIRRDAAKRATAWEAWDEEWLTRGSLLDESSAGGEAILAPLDPRSSAGQDWLTCNARVQSGALEIVKVD